MTRQESGSWSPQLKALEPVMVLLEASGGLELPLVTALAAEAVPVVVVNPRQVRDFAKATGKLAKTDALDAAVLAQGGGQNHHAYPLGHSRIMCCRRHACICRRDIRGGNRVRPRIDCINIHVTCNTPLRLGQSLRKVSEY